MKRCDYCGKEPTYHAAQRCRVRGRYILCGSCMLAQLHFLPRRPGTTLHGTGYEMLYNTFVQD
jgi:hypothetical protein